MLAKVVIDEQLAGWKELHYAKLKSLYENVLSVGVDPSLPKGIKDKPLAAYCKREKCLLLTCDRKVYVNFFEDGTETIHIKTFGKNEQSGQTIYSVAIFPSGPPQGS